MKIFIIGLFIFFIFSCANKKEEELNTDIPSDKIKVRTQVENLKTESNKRDSVNYYKNQISNEIDKITKDFDTMNFRGELSCLLDEINLFDSMAQKIEQANKLNDDEITELNKNAAEKLIALQTVEFPKIRVEFVSLMNKQKSQKKIKHQITGNNNQIIEFIGDRYFDIDSVLNDEAEIIDIMYRMRFKSAFYRYDELSEILTRFDFKSLQDSQLAYKNIVPKAKSLKERLNE